MLFLMHSINGDGSSAVAGTTPQVVCVRSGLYPNRRPLHFFPGMGGVWA